MTITNDGTLMPTPTPCPGWCNAGKFFDHTEYDTPTSEAASWVRTHSAELTGPIDVLQDERVKADGSISFGNPYVLVATDAAAMFDSAGVRVLMNQLEVASAFLWAITGA